MKLQHWFIAVALALLIGCATTDSHRDEDTNTLFSKSDSTAVGLLLVVDNDQIYELDEKAVKLTLSPGQHQIDLVEARGASAIDSVCISSNISLEATFLVHSRTLGIVTDYGSVVMGGKGRVTHTENGNSVTISSCS